MFKWLKRKPKKTEMDEQLEKRLAVLRNKLDAANRAMEVLDHLFVERRLNSNDNKGPERRSS